MKSSFLQYYWSSPETETAALQPCLFPRLNFYLDNAENGNLVILLPQMLQGWIHPLGNMLQGQKQLLWILLYVHNQKLILMKLELVLNKLCKINAA